MNQNADRGTCEKVIPSSKGTRGPKGRTSIKNYENSEYE